MNVTEYSLHDFDVQQDRAERLVSAQPPSAIMRCTRSVVRFGLPTGKAESHLGYLDVHIAIQHLLLCSTTES